MIKKFLRYVMVGTLLLSTIAGCGNGNTASQGSNNTQNSQSFKIGMVTDLGSIDDKSFNQLTWEGIQQADATYGTTSKYLKPGSADQVDLQKEVTNLYDAGFRFIITPGHKFASTIYTVQDLYPEAKFIILDAVPMGSDGTQKVGSNTVVALFKEHEAGFLAGVAAAVQIKEGNAGFIGGMETEAVQRFNWGYQQGIQYANDHYGTQIKMDPSNFIYQGTFSEVAAGQQISAQMYDRGVDFIFSAAGGVGSGVIKEARERAERGDKVWVIGVDSDQYDEGIYAGNDSVILTSALKKVGTATFNIIGEEVNGTFPGGQTLHYGVENDGVGLPAENPNLSEAALAAVNEVYSAIQNGQITVNNTGDGLIK